METGLQYCFALTEHGCGFDFVAQGSCSGGRRSKRIRSLPLTDQVQDLFQRPVHGGDVCPAVRHTGSNIKALQPEAVLSQGGFLPAVFLSKVFPGVFAACGCCGVQPGRIP